MNKINNAVNILEEIITHSKYVEHLLFHALSYSEEKNEIIAFCDIASEINNKIQEKADNVIDVLWKR